MMYFLIAVCVFVRLCVVDSVGNFKGAVYEHVVISPTDAEGNFTREEAFKWMSKNLDVYKEQVKRAAEQGVKIIVFPEYGITGFDHNRNSIVPFLENIPDPGSGSAPWNPCVEPQKYPQTLVLNRLSCLARTNEIYVVANMGDVKPCDNSIDVTCPADGRYQLNTNVVFDPTGTLISRYHKRNLYDESPLFDPSPEIEYSYFDTPYGRFGSVVCFDLLHEYPTQALLKDHSVDTLLVTSAWNVFYPFVIATQMYAGISKRNKINVMASNIRHQEYVMAGSGIFTSGASAVSDPVFQSPEGVLLTLELQSTYTSLTVDGRLTAIYNTFDNIPFKNITHFGQYDYGMNMSFAVLNKDSEQVVVCSETVCCAVEYKFLHYDPDELFVVGTSDFSMTYPGKIHMQFCAVHKCLNSSLSSCGGFVISSDSSFSKLKVQAFFDTSLVFPFVSTSPFENITVDMERDSYMFDKDNAILESKSFKHPLLAAVVFNSVSSAERVQQSVSGTSRVNSLTWSVTTVVALSNIVIVMAI